MTLPTVDVYDTQNTTDLGQRITEMVAAQRQFSVVFGYAGTYARICSPNGATRPAPEPKACA